MKALVTGGGGFLGLAIVRRLIGRGADVQSFSRTRHAVLDDLGVGVHQGDLADASAVCQATAGCDLVFHVAALAGVWGKRKDYERTNVQGTANVIAACRQHGVRRLVYTSSPSVVFDGTDQARVDESASYPRRFLAHYPRTKALAEQRVLAANGPKLATVSLRPHLIWGSGDNHLVPRIVARARAGRLRLVGSGRKPVDSVYIDNAADAHLAAADRLAPGSVVAGKAYFITNGEPLPMGELINRIVAAAGLPQVTATISPRLAYVAGAMLEAVYTVLGLSNEPPMTRFVARQLATAHYYDTTAAARDLGYQPKISIEQGMQRLQQSFKEKQARDATSARA
jgi:nucleoside-diphosphate-sugar epimerase